MKGIDYLNSVSERISGKGPSPLNSCPDVMVVKSEHHFSTLEWFMPRVKLLEKLYQKYYALARDHYYDSVEMVIESDQIVYSEKSNIIEFVRHDGNEIRGVTYRLSELLNIVDLRNCMLSKSRESLSEIETKCDEVLKALGQLIEQADRLRDFMKEVREIDYYPI